ncbi:sugar ABC transporter substrate-binding protein [Allostreptomyces psammosilenae]|uniref:D-xylose transport system substrate-binding protein n=1 Tax=Allostreptomyces psammosilenae TaxID=1892865 RepID=A0A852ZLF9_9ACTN|nr:substrate-binding domain-containing protein [Allostreptomyces psammosilenae]NYI03216.1 D-xylose transport system substrate-binding protein [Allostreptomyces psammosilenae]
MKTRTRRFALAAAALSLTTGLAACGTAEQAGNGDGGNDSSNASGASDGIRIGLLLPESKTARYEKFDRPYIEEAVAELCADCEVLYANASQDPAKQQQQVDSMLTDGVDVLILDAVDYKAIESSVNKAEQQGVPVVAYDRLAEGPIDAYVSFDNVAIGRLQGEALLEAMRANGDPMDGQTILINGSPTDPNAGQFKQGMHEALDGNVQVAAEYDVPDWSPDQAQTSAAGAITAAGVENVVGVYAANDGMAGGVIAALKAAGADPLPPVSGQDAEITGVQRILSGEQTMTIYKAIRPEAQAAAEFAVALARGEEITTATGTVDNATARDVPATIIAPTVLTRDNIAETVVADGYWTIEEICDAAHQDACREAGLLD